MKNTFILIFFALSLQISAQLQNTNWYFGNQAAVNFNDGTSPPTIINNSSLNTIEGCASVSDSSGSLLFYTNGVTVWNRNNEIMLNGENLLGHISSTQSAIIIQDLSNESKYYIFTSNGESGNRLGFHYSIVNMNLDNNLGGIILDSKNLDLYSSNGIPFNHSNSEKITSYFNRDENIVWIIIYHRNKIFSFKLDENGFNPQSLTSTFMLLPFPNNYPVGIGTLKVAPNGQQLAISFGSGTGAIDSVFTASFNDMTGQISNLTGIPLEGVYSIEFSPNSQYLYMHTFLSINQTTTRQINNNNEKIFRIDIKNNEIKNIEFASSITEIANGLHVGTLQTAIDGKIYYNNGEFLGVIHNPDVETTQLNIDNNYLFLHRSSGLGLPQKVPEICFGEWSITYETEYSKWNNITKDTNNNIIFGSIVAGAPNAPYNVYDGNDIFMYENFIAKFSNNGCLIWKHFLEYDGGTTKIKTDSENNIIALTNKNIYKFDTNGNLLFKYSSNKSITNFTIDSTNNIFLIIKKSEQPLHIYNNNGIPMFESSNVNCIILKINYDGSFANNIQLEIQGGEISNIIISEDYLAFLSGYTNNPSISVNSQTISLNTNSFIIKCKVLPNNYFFINYINIEYNATDIVYNNFNNKLYVSSWQYLYVINNDLTNPVIIESPSYLRAIFIDEINNLLLFADENNIYQLNQNNDISILISNPISTETNAYITDICQTTNGNIFCTGQFFVNNFSFGTYINRFNENGEENRISNYIPKTSQEITKSTIYPNPFTNIIYISNNGSSDILDCTLYNMKMKKIKQIDIVKNKNGLKVNVATITNGVYFIRIRFKNGKIEEQKLLKI